MEDIAEKFGVTRQRVSALLREAGGEVSSDGGRARPPTKWQRGGTARLASGRGRPRRLTFSCHIVSQYLARGRPPPRPSSSPRTTRARRSGPSRIQRGEGPRAPIHGQATSRARGHIHSPVLVLVQSPSMGTLTRFPRVAPVEAQAV